MNEVTDLLVIFAVVFAVFVVAVLGLGRLLLASGRRRSTRR